MGLSINFTYDSSVSGAPSAFKTALAQAAQYLGSMISNTITVNIEVGWGTFGNASAGNLQTVPANSALGGTYGGQIVSYAGLRSILASNGVSGDDASALASLGIADPIAGRGVYLSAAQCKALGLSTSSQYDGAIGFGAGATVYNFDVNNRGAAGGWDFFGLALHEITHALGRIAALSPTTDSLLDLYRYSAAGTRQFTSGAAAYFSLDGGVTRLADFSTTSESSDWAASAGKDANVAVAAAGLNNFSAIDARELDALGFNLSTFTVAGAIAARNAALPDLWTPVADTANNISAGLSQLRALYDGGNLASLSVATGPSDYVFATQAQYADNRDLFAFIQGPWSLTVAKFGSLTMTMGASQRNMLMIDGGEADVTGNSLDNVIDTGAGTDRLFGGDGADTLIGGDDDRLSGAEASIYRLYGATLGRAPDVGGFTAWTAQLQKGVPLDSIAAGFVGSPEFQQRYGSLNNSQFVTLLYNNVLHRDPDAAGYAGWLAMLNGGMSRTGVVTGFSESAEYTGSTELVSRAFATSVLHGDFVGEIYRLYGATLGRTPAPIEMENWAPAATQGYSLADLTSFFTGSTEFQQRYGSLDNNGFVTLLYNNVLGRAPDSAGLSGWVGLLNGGASRETVTMGFSESAEYRSDTAGALGSFMQNDVVNWKNLLNGGQGDDVLIGGRGADEFQFDRAEPGSDQVLGLQTRDTLSFINFGYTNASQALGHMAQSGADVVFRDQGETVTFRDTSLAVVSSASFSFW